MIRLRDGRLNARRGDQPSPKNRAARSPSMVIGQPQRVESHRPATFRRRARRIEVIACIETTSTRGGTFLSNRFGGTGCSASSADGEYTHGLPNQLKMSVSGAAPLLCRMPCFRSFRSTRVAVPADYQPSVSRRRKLECREEIVGGRRPSSGTPSAPPHSKLPHPGEHRATRWSGFTGLSAGLPPRLFVCLARLLLNLVELGPSLIQLLLEVIASAYLHVIPYTTDHNLPTDF